MTKSWAAFQAAALLLCAAAARSHAEEALKLIQRPTFWIIGQWTRILVETPADCGALEVIVPGQLKLVDRWPHKSGDTMQRFYLRAVAPMASGTIAFRSGQYRLDVPVRVLSWREVLTERFEVPLNPPGAETRGGTRWGDTLTLPRLFPMEGADERKSARSYLRPEGVERHRQELSRDLRGAAIENLPLTENLAELFHALPESTIPRAAYVNNPVYQAASFGQGGTLAEPVRGCPVCGEKVFEGRSAFYPWVLDREHHPLKIQCPECQRWFPSNDFAAGDMTGGEFPDDGWGYFDAKGRPYSFIGYYVLQNCRGGDRRAEEFSRYYLATGDRRWARATAVVLFRVAEQYLNLALNVNQRERYTRDNLWRGAIPPQGTPPPSFASYFSPGFYLDAIWTIGPDVGYAEALERIWDYFEGDDPELIAFLRGQHHGEIQTARDVCDFIETGYFRTVAQGILDYSIAGNGPAEQAMAMRLALLLNTPRAIDLVAWVFNNPAHGMRHYLSNRFFKDGSGYESPGYNNGHYESTAGIADLLGRLMELRPEQYAESGFPLLPEELRFKQMYDHNIDISLISRTYANVGDDGDLAYTDPLPLRPGASLTPGAWVKAFQRWPGEVHYARALWDANAGAPVRELTDPSLRAKATELVRRGGPHLNLPSQVLDGFGQVILRSGEGEDQRALWMRYGTMFGHGHHDALTIGFEALQRTLLPEQGYYRGEAHRTEWDMNWAIHYCGRILGASGEPTDDWGRQGRGGASLRLFGDGGWAKMATAARRFYRDARAPRVLEVTHDLVQERTIALVDLDARHSYAVSIFRLKGGTDHYLSFHGPRGGAEPTGLQPVAQDGGTLAGPNVPYGIKWDSPWSRQNPHLMCFPFLYDVRRATSAGRWSVRWDLEKHPDVHVRLHSATPPGGDVALCRGKPPGGGKPYELEWVMQRTTGADPLSTRFLEVIEAYRGEPLIAEVRPLPMVASGAAAEHAIACQVVAGDRVDTIVQCDDPDVLVRTQDGIAMQGELGIWSEEGGRVKRVFLVRGTRIERQGGDAFTAPSKEYRGEIISVDFRRRKIVVSPGIAPEPLAGRYARITNPQGNDVTHSIESARGVPGGVELTLRWDPRIGEGPVKEIHDDGVTSAVTLLFGGLYFRGKTLSNEDHSRTYKIHGVKDSRAYIHGEAHPGLDKGALSRDFADRDGDGIARFLIYDYGVGDEISLPTIISR